MDHLLLVPLLCKKEILSSSSFFSLVPSNSVHFFFALLNVTVLLLRHAWQLLYYTVAPFVPDTCEKTTQSYHLQTRYDCTCSASLFATLLFASDLIAFIAFYNRKHCIKPYDNYTSYNENCFVWHMKCLLLVLYALCLFLFFHALGVLVCLLDVTFATSCHDSHFYFYSIISASAAISFSFMLGLRSRIISQYSKCFLFKYWFYEFVATITGKKNFFAHSLFLSFSLSPSLSLVNHWKVNNRNCLFPSINTDVEENYHRNWMEWNIAEWGELQNKQYRTHFQWIHCY